VAALILDANPSLSAMEVKEILMRTATRMPGLEEFEAGIGYVNAHTAVDLALRRSKAYGSFLEPAFTATVATNWAPEEPHALTYIPAPPGPDSPNTFRFQVEPGINLLSVIADFGKGPVTDETGNAMGLVLWPPGCQEPMSPTGQRPSCVYSSGIALPVLDGPKRQVVVKNPVAGEWIAEFGGVRGLAAAPEASSPVGISLPDQIDSRVARATFSLAPVADVTGHPFEASIYQALLNRQTDLRSDGLYHPDDTVTRGDFARHLALNVPVRQSLANTPRFGDVSGDLGAIAEAVTARGATLRDFDFSAEGLMSAAGGAFNPDGLVSRLDVAVAFVRGVGRDAEARSKAGIVVMSGGLAITDNAAIPAALRGYVQIALDLGLMEVFPAQVIVIGGQFVALPGPRFEPDSTLTRGLLAGKLSNFARIFASTF
jgi:serine protease AprX